MMRSILFTLFLVTVTVACVTAAAKPFRDDVVVKGTKIYVNGTEFFVKGIAYNPVPLGALSMDKNGFKGGGYCSAKKTVFGEYKSACFGSDYFDGVTANEDRDPKGPSHKNGKLKPWWYDVWTRDFKKMKKLGVNTLRLYNLNTLTKTFFKMYPDEYKDVKDKTVAADHKHFMDLAHSYGFKVILPVVPDQSFLVSTPEALVNKHIEAQVRDIGNHPALLIWMLGNEMDVFGNKDLRNLVNKYMKRVRDRTIAIHKRRIPVSTAVIDNPDQYDFLVKNLDVDVFTTNAGYRDVFMEPLWTGERKFKGWTYLSKKYKKPLLIGEVGMHQHPDEITKARPDWFNQQWKIIVSHLKDGCIGACFFEYSDEPNKNIDDRHMGAVIPKKTIIAGGKTSLDADVFVADTVIEKPVVFRAIQKGHPGSRYKAYNMRANAFKLAGLTQTTIPVKSRK